MSANVSPMSSYVDTHILECSRQSSVQVQSNANTSNALFMNKLNEGIQLNVGDKVSVHSAIISEVGAGGNTIEMKGNVIGNSTLKKITTIENKREPENYNSPGYPDVIERADAQEVTQSDKTIELRDNTVNMVVQYYKATNGENCFSLPRVYGGDTEGVTSDYVWTSNDNASQGATLHQQQNGHIVEDDYQRDRNSGSAWTNKWLTNRELLKVRQDGTKYTIFVRKGFTYFNASYPGVSFDDVTNGNSPVNKIDPAVAPYVPYRELKTVTIPKGRRSADFIAETFTRSLQNASNLDPYNYWANLNNPSTSLVYDNQQLVAGIYKTDTYKPFTAATFDGFSQTNFNYLDYEDQTSLDWINSFQYVAFKRPEFVEAGRSDFNEDASNLGPPHYITNVSSDSVHSKTNMKIEFNASYTEDNCSRINKWVKTQSLYPEFWDFRNASSPYHNRTVTSTITLHVAEDQISGLDAINCSYTTDKLVLDPSDVVSRTITFSNASITPSGEVTVTSIFTEEEFQTQSIFWGGETTALIPGGTPITFTITDVLPEVTIDNSRFFHIDMVQTIEPSSKTLASDRRELGSDMYWRTSLENASQYNVPSSPLFVYYQDVDKNNFYEDPEYNDRDKKLTYGLFLKGPNGNIQVSTEGIGGVPSDYYNTSGFFIGGTSAVGDGSYALPKYKRHFGYDVHFSAYGNAAIGLWSGVTINDRAKNVNPLVLELTANGGASTGGVENGWDFLPQINKVYVGATEPQLTYDNVKDRFGFTGFYTPEFLGNKGGAGDDATDNPVRDGGAKVYKVNKRLRNQNWCPGMGPYPVEASFNVNKIDASTSVKLNYDAPNRNIYPFSFMDCHSGIAIESFGITEALWDKSLMSILGFNYEQLQATLTSENTLQKRINTNNIGQLNKVTTQADIKAVDTLLYNQNIFGAIMYHPNILICGRLQEHGGHKYHNLLTPLSIDTDSLTVTADGVPKQMINPFYTIRSDILDEATYLGGEDSGIKLPVISHVLKGTDSGDFFTSFGTGIDFTITKPKVVTSITTAICDPDGTFSRVDENSAVLYKIDKNAGYPVNVLASILGKK